jgi:hypothetical protein
VINREELESEFIQQVILNDTLFDGIVVMEQTLGIEFERLNFNIWSSLNADLNCIQSGDIINMSDSDLFLLFKQYRLNQCYEWKSEKFPGRRILKNQEDKHLIDSCDNLPGELYWLKWHEKFGKGKLQCSRPLFYDNGRFAIFNMSAFWDYCKGKRECVIYQKSHGKWQFFRILRGDIIC